MRDILRVVVTDQLGSDGAATGEMLPSLEHRQHRYPNNRAENFHQASRRWERRMPGFRSLGHAQRFLAAYSPITSYFRPGRQRLSAPAYRQEMRQRFRIWREITVLAMAA